MIGKFLKKMQTWRDDVRVMAELSIGHFDGDGRWTSQISIHLIANFLTHSKSAGGKWSHGGAAKRESR